MGAASRSTTCRGWNCVLREVRRRWVCGQKATRRLRTPCLRAKMIRKRAIFARNPPRHPRLFFRQQTAENCPEILAKDKVVFWQIETSSILINMTENNFSTPDIDPSSTAVIKPADRSNG